MRFAHWFFVFAICLTPMLGCGDSGSGAGSAVANKSEIEQFLAENPDLDNDEINEGTVDEVGKE